MVFPRHRAVIFVHGCFWHGHDCALFRWPSSREEFWRTKITGNIARDARVREQLQAAGWRILKSGNAQ
jgi:DNA mismatch endonuclease (patch repair protein)